MVVSVRSLAGLSGIPSDRTAISDWLKRKRIVTVFQQGNGGEIECVQLSDLPADVRLAYWRRELDDLGLDPGVYDDAAHEAFAGASSKARARAERRAAIATLLVSLRAKGVTESERFALVREQYGEQGTSTASLKRLQKAVQGLVPINFAPALLDEYKATRERAEMSEDAWRFFMTMIRDAAPEWPLKEAWRRVRDAGKPMGWEVLSFSTFYRRWQALSEAQRLEARYGKADTAKRLTMPAHRDKTTIASLEWVSLDGRMQDFWVDWGDGKAVRPVMIALVDVSSNVVLDWELAPSENAAATSRVIKRVCQNYGIFDQLYTDNGSAFTGHLVAGGSSFRFRNGKAKGLQPMGICQIMGISLRFALPANAQAKIAERTFATLSRSIDDGPEFKGAHAGHSPRAVPSPDVTPIDVETAKAVIKRQVQRHNQEPGRRSQGAHGRSYEQILRDGVERRERPLLKPTARQLYLSSLIWKPVAVDRNGQVKVSGWVYGGAETQGVLLEYHGKGQRILLGRDPDDLSAPAMAYDENGTLICEGIESIKRGAYGSLDGIRDAARNRKAAREATAAAEAANDYLADGKYAAAIAALDENCKSESVPPLPPQKVVGGRFGAPLRDAAPTKDETQEIVPEEYFRNMETALAAKTAKRGKPA